MIPLKTRLDPFTPLGFHIADIGQQVRGGPPITIQLDGSWDKATNMGGAAWVASMNPLHTHFS